MTSNPVMIVVPTKTGFVLMPFDMNCLMSLGDGRHKVHACESLDSLTDKLREVYAPEEAVPGNPEGQ